MANYEYIHITADPRIVGGMRTRLLHAYAGTSAYDKFTVGAERYDPTTDIGTQQSIFRRRDAAKLLAILPEWLTRLEVPKVSLVEISSSSTNQVLPRHVDDGRFATLNWYVKTSGETTSFDDGDFTAGTGDFVLMNSQEPHSVKLSGATRKMVSFSYIHHTYNEILEARHAN